MNAMHDSSFSPAFEGDAAPASASRDVLLLPPPANRGGAPKGNRNAVTHGRYTAERRAQRKRIRDLIRNVKTTLGALSQGTKKPRVPSRPLPLVRSENREPAATPK